MITAQICGSDIDAALVRLEAGLDLALQRAKAWSKYARDIMNYIEKKTQLGMDMFQQCFSKIISYIF